MSLPALGIVQYSENILAENGAQFGRLVNHTWGIQTGKQAGRPGEILNFNADTHSIILFFKMSF